VRGETPVKVEDLLEGGAGVCQDFAHLGLGLLLAGAAHVKIGHGRRYDDIPPIKCVSAADRGAEMESSVQMTRADASGVPA
jgi:hypothetical protein